MDDLQDGVGSSVNDTGTCATIDTPVTQRRSRRVRGRLLANRLRKLALGKVYFVRAGDAIKIGFTTASQARVSALQTSNADKLALLGVVDGTERDERALHGRFHHLHIRGEWFRAEPDLLSHISFVTKQPDLAQPAPEKPAMSAPTAARPQEQRSENADLDRMSLSLHRFRAPLPRDDQRYWLASNIIQQIDVYQESDDELQKVALKTLMAHQIQMLSAA